MIQTKKVEICPGTKVAVIGLGVSGMAAVKYLLQKGAHVFASDLSDGTRVKREDVAAFGTVEFEFGQHSIDFVSQGDFALLGPGVSLRAAIVAQLQERGIPILGELALLAEELKEPVIGVTGTNGKTTVTELISTILAAGGLDVFAGGNLGTPVYDHCRRAENRDVAVLEVSSFQLDLSGSFKPHVGILLNVKPDHLDRHGSMEAYVNAKKRLFSHQTDEDFAIINGDDRLCCLTAGEHGNGRVFRFGYNKKFEAVIDEESSTIKTVLDERAFSLEGTALENRTGLLNAAPSILAAQLMGCSHGQIVKGLQVFKPLEHRLEYVGELEGVAYYNDSKATNSGAVIHALSQVTGKRVVLIAGGRDKGDDYRLLRPSIEEKVKVLILLGEAATLMEKVLQGAAEIYHAASLEEAVITAKECAERGDVVMLSPACASFDMFENYVQRGEMFKQLVRDMMTK